VLVALALMIEEVVEELVVIYALHLFQFVVQQLMQQ
jgi:hypothetical protein